MLAQRYHPDNQETGDQEQFRLLIEAYRVVSDPEKRAAYDATLMHTRQLRWKIFDRPADAQGKEAEKRKRAGVLSLLYAQRVNQPEKPVMSIPELEDLLGCPREHLEFTLWYLREAGCIVRGDNGRFTITIRGSKQSNPMRPQILPRSASRRWQGKPEEVPPATGGAHSVDRPLHRISRFRLFSRAP
jgi:curved DNA-binding protein CbpA